MATSSTFKDLPYSKTTKIEAMEQLLAQNKWDTEAWDSLFEEVSSQPIGQIRPLYEEYFKVFPTAAKGWKTLVTQETQAGNFEKVEQILQDTLLSIPHCQLWQAYLDYVKITKSKEETERAYEFALSTIGSDINSFELWMGYFEFMKQLKSEGSLTDSRLLNVRKRLKEVLEYQVHKMDEFWRTFEAFESDHVEKLYPNPAKPGDDRLASQQHVKDMSAKYKRSLICYKEKTALRQNLIEDFVSVPDDAPNSPFSPSQGPPVLSASTLLPSLMQGNLSKRTREQLQAPIWIQVLEYEKANNQKLEKEELHKRVSLLYKQATLCLYYTPEIWHSSAAYHAKHGTKEETISVFERSLKALPQNMVLHLAFVEYLRSIDDLPRATQVFDQFIEHTNKAGSDNSLMLIHYLRFMHKTKGMDEARKLFMKVKGSAGWQFFTATAHLEWRLNKQPAVARNIFELGMNSHSDRLAYVMAYLDLLEALNDENNLRLLYEKAVIKHNIPEVWNKYLEYAYQFTDEKGSREIEDRMSTSLPHLAPKTNLRKLIDRYKFLDLLPLSQAQLSAQDQQDVVRLALARFTSTKVDSATFQQIYGTLDISNSSSTMPSLKPNDALPLHKNPLLELFCPRQLQPDFASLPSMVPPKNTHPPEPSQDQLSDVPCVPPAMLTGFSTARGVAVPFAGTASLPSALGMQLGPNPAQQMALMAARMQAQQVPAPTPAAASPTPGAGRATSPQPVVVKQEKPEEDSKDAPPPPPAPIATPEAASAATRAMSPTPTPAPTPTPTPVVAVPAPAPSVVIPPPPAPPKMPELPSLLAKLLAVLPPPNLYNGPLADVDVLLSLLVNNQLPPPPEVTTGPMVAVTGVKRPAPDSEDGPDKRPAVDVYAQRQAARVAR